MVDEAPQIHTSGIFPDGGAKSAEAEKHLSRPLPTEFSAKADKVGVSAVIPCYNEEKRISRVLSVVTQAQLVSEVLVVDDGSADQTAAVVRREFPQAVYLRHPQNQGKAAALCDGVAQARGEIVVFLDADLQNLKSDHVDNLVRPVLTGQAEMAVLLRGRAPFLYRRIFHSDPTLSGERCLCKEDFLELQALHPELPTVHYAVEVLLNDYFISRRKKVVVVVAPGVDQLYKEQKEGFWRGFWDNLKMSANLTRYIGVRKYLHQLYFYSRLA